MAARIKRPSPPTKNHPRVTAGGTVTYHGEDGDEPLAVIRFNMLGRADLQLDDETVLAGVREGPEAGQWSR